MRRLNNFSVLKAMDINWSYQALLFWAGVFWDRLSTSQTVRCFKLKKLKRYMSYQVDFLLPLKLQKLSCYFGLSRRILLANQFAGFFTLRRVWLVNFNNGGSLLHCTCCYCRYYYCCYYYHYFCSLFNFGQNSCKW